MGLQILIVDDRQAFQNEAKFLCGLNGVDELDFPPVEAGRAVVITDLSHGLLWLTRTELANRPPVNRAFMAAVDAWIETRT